MFEHELDVVGQAPDLFFADQVDRGRGDDLVVVVDQVEQCLFDVARAGLQD
jgi:hypothetical protein